MAQSDPVGGQAVDDVWSPDYPSDSEDPGEIAEELRAIEERMEASEYDPEDVLFLYGVSESLDYEGLRQYSEDLIDEYADDFLREELSEFEEYRNPWQYAKSLAKDAKAAIANSYYGETGVEIFMDKKDTVKGEAEFRTFQVMKTNVGREVVLNFLRYKQLNVPFLDLVGAGYGFCKGARMEIEDRDIEERFSEVVDFLDDASE